MNKMHGWIKGQGIVDIINNKKLKVPCWRHPGLPGLFLANIDVLYPIRHTWTQWNLTHEKTGLSLCTQHKTRHQLARLAPLFLREIDWTANDLSANAGAVVRYFRGRLGVVWGDHIRKEPAAEKYLHMYQRKRIKSLLSTLDFLDTSQIEKAAKVAIK